MPEASEELHTLLRRSYQGEAFGEGFFRAMGERTAERDLKRKLGALELLERQTKERLAPFVDPGGDQADEGASATAAEAACSLPWPEFMTALLDGLVQPLEDYRRIDALAPDAEHRHLAADLIAHEQAVETFALRERAGETDPIGPVLGLLGPSLRVLADDA